MVRLELLRQLWVWVWQVQQPNAAPAAAAGPRATASLMQAANGVINYVLAGTRSYELQLWQGSRGHHHVAPSLERLLRTLHLPAFIHVHECHKSNTADVGSCIASHQQNLNELADTVSDMGWQHLPCILPVSHAALLKQQQSASSMLIKTQAYVCYIQRSSQHSIMRLPACHTNSNALCKP